MRHLLKSHNTQRYRMVKQMLLLTSSSLTLLSRVTFVIFLSRQKLVGSLPNVVHVTLITGRKVDQSSFITIKSVISNVRPWVLSWYNQRRGKSDFVEFLFCVLFILALRSSESIFINIVFDINQFSFLYFCNSALYQIVFTKSTIHSMYFSYDH